MIYVPKIAQNFPQPPFQIKICFYISAKLCIRSFCCYNLLLVFLHYIYVYEFMLFKIILDKKKNKICQKASVGQPFFFVVSSIMKQISEISMYLDLISFTTIFSLYCIDKSGFYRHNNGITFLFLMLFVPSKVIKLFQNFSDKFTLQFTA